MLSFLQQTPQLDSLILTDRNRQPPLPHNPQPTNILRMPPIISNQTGPAQRINLMKFNDLVLASRQNVGMEILATEDGVLVALDEGDEFHLGEGEDLGVVAVRDQDYELGRVGGFAAWLGVLYVDYLVVEADYCVHC